MPDWWLDEEEKDVEKDVVIRKPRCPGEPCLGRMKANHGNKLCSNGGLCSDCCQKYQEIGFRSCDYAAHNYDRTIEKVRVLQVRRIERD